MIGWQDRRREKLKLALKFLATQWPENPFAGISTRGKRIMFGRKEAKFSAVYVEFKVPMRQPNKDNQ